MITGSLRAWRSGGTPGWDEAHLARDFRLLAGVSPGRWQQEFPFFPALEPAGLVPSGS